MRAACFDFTTYAFDPAISKGQNGENMFTYPISMVNMFSPNGEKWGTSVENW